MLFEQFILSPTQAFKKLLAVDGLDFAAFEIVIPALEHFPRLRKLVEESGHGVLYQLVGPASADRGEGIELFLKVGIQVYFHKAEINGKSAVNQRQKAGCRW